MDPFDLTIVYSFLKVPCMFRQSRSGFQSSSLSFSAPQKSRWLPRVLATLFVAMLTAGLTLMAMSMWQKQPVTESLLNYAGKNECEVRFEGEGVSLIENHCGASAGVYLMTPQGLRTSNLIEPEISEQIRTKGCEAPNRCVYQLELQGNAIRGQFDYTFEGAEGFYTFEWLQGGSVQLVESSAG